MSNDLIERIEKLEKTQNQIGVINSIQPEKGTARVILRDGTISGELQYLVPYSQDTKVCRNPDIGEQVMICFVGEKGFIVGTYYSQADTVPWSDPSKVGVRFEDGSTYSHDRSTKSLEMNVKGKIDLTSKDNTTVTAPIIELNSNCGINDGVITMSSVCPLHGGMHFDGSQTVRAGKQ